MKINTFGRSLGAAVLSLGLFGFAAQSGAQALGGASQPVGAYATGLQLESALASRQALIDAIASQYRGEFMADQEFGGARYQSFVQGLHATPSSVLEKARLASTVKSFETGRLALVAAAKTKGVMKGAPEEELIFVPTGPCRIADSRLAPAGRMENGNIRTFANYSASGQGGDAACIENARVPSGAPGVLVMNVTSTGAQGTGYLSLRPLGAPSGTSTVNLMVGQDAANTASVRMSGVPGQDFEVYSLVNGGAGKGTHVVLDLLGYYIASNMVGLEKSVAVYSDSAPCTLTTPDNVVVEFKSTLAGAGCTQPTGPDLSYTVGPSGRALVTLSATMGVSNNHMSCHMSVVVGTAGATGSVGNVALSGTSAADATSLSTYVLETAGGGGNSRTFLITGQTPGATVTLSPRYRTGDIKQTCTFKDRSIIVQSF